MSRLQSTRFSWSTGYEWGIGLLGLATGFYYLPQLFHQPLFVTIFLFILAILLEVFPVPLGKANSSLLIAMPVAVALTYGMAEAVWLMVVAELVFPTILRQTMKNSVRIFNAGQYALSTWVMGRLMSWLVQGPSGALTDWQTYVQVIIGFGSFIVINHGLIHLLQYFRGQFDVSDILHMLYGEIINVVISLPFALLVIATAPQHPLAAPTVLIPIILLGQTLGLYRRNGIMQEIYQSTGRLTAEFDVTRISQAVAEMAAKITYADTVVVLLEQNGTEGQVFVPSAIYPRENADELETFGEVKIGEGLLGQALESQLDTYVRDLRKDPWVSMQEANDSYLSVGVLPMRARQGVVGAIVCYSRHAYAFNERLRHAGTLSNQVAVLVENARLYQALQEQSRRDAATGLYNYRYFYEALARQMQEAERIRQSVSVVIIDVDYFKKFNDTYGHLAGDKVLLSLASLMLELAGPQAVVARYGGEEFGLIFPFDELVTYEIAEEIRTAVSKHTVEFEGYQLRGISVSIGIASYPRHAQSDRDLLLKADSAMYWGAKQRGRNHTAVYSPEFDGQLFVDELTGLYTYHFLSIRVREEIRQGVTQWGAICLNVDNLTRVNETFGFSKGDRALRELSLVLKEGVRHTELTGRFAGDEFLVLLPNVTESELATIGERINKAVINHRFDVGTNVTLSLRVRQARGVYMDVQDVTNLLDQVGRLFASLHHVDESLA